MTAIAILKMIMKILTLLKKYSIQIDNKKKMTSIIISSEHDHENPCFNKKYLIEDDDKDSPIFFYHIR